MEAGGGRCKPFLRWVLFMVGSFCQVSGVKEIARTQLLEENRLLLTKNKPNKNHPIGEKQTGRLAGLDKAGLDTRHRRPNIR